MCLTTTTRVGVPAGSFTSPYLPILERDRQAADDVAEHGVVGRQERRVAGDDEELAARTCPAARSASSPSRPCRAGTSSSAAACRRPSSRGRRCRSRSGRRPGSRSPGTTRWKIVLSKKRERASETKEAVVLRRDLHGEQDRERAAARLHRRRPRLARDRGGPSAACGSRSAASAPSTFGQPLACVAALVDAPPSVAASAASDDEDERAAGHRAQRTARIAPARARSRDSASPTPPVTATMSAMCSSLKVSRAGAEPVALVLDVAEALPQVARGRQRSRGAARAPPPGRRARRRR